MSKRTQIRNAVSDALLGKTAADQTVFTSRYSALFSETYPLILIYSPEEECEIYIAGPRQYQRKLTLNIVAIVQADDLVDDALDSFSSDIEAAMNADLTFGGIAMGAALKKLSSEVNTEGAMQLAAMTQTYEVEYFE